MDYEQDCAEGRMQAEHDLATLRKTENLPQFVQKVREAAADHSGFGVGYLFALGERAAA